MNFEKQVDALVGVYSPIFTPFTDDNQVNFEMLTLVMEYQLSKGMQGFFVTGSTGEGLLLTFDERIAVIRHVAELCRERATVIAHVGHPSSDFAARLAVQAAQAGVDWIASVGPIYHGTTFDGAMRHYRHISETVPQLPFMVYALETDIQPQRDAAIFEIPNTCGMKYTGSNYFSVQQLARFVDKPIALLSGMDELFVAGQSYGFQGGIGTTFNFAPGIYADIYRQYHAGNVNEATRLQAEINKVTMLMIEYENWSYRKAFMRYIGLDCGHCRPPYESLTEQQYEQFATRVDELGVLVRNDAEQVAEVSTLRGDGKTSN